jgi:hypothetical protein
MSQQSYQSKKAFGSMRSIGYRCALLGTVCLVALVMTNASVRAGCSHPIQDGWYERSAELDEYMAVSLSGGSRRTGLQVEFVVTYAEGIFSISLAYKTKKCDGPNCRPASPKFGFGMAVAFVVVHVDLSAVDTQRWYARLPTVSDLINASGLSRLDGFFDAIERPPRLA